MKVVKCCALALTVLQMGLSLTASADEKSAAATTSSAVEKGKDKSCEYIHGKLHCPGDRLKRKIEEMENQPKRHD